MAFWGGDLDSSEVRGGGDYKRPVKWLFHHGGRGEFQAEPANTPHEASTM